jgi:hypothetical protein
MPSLDWYQASIPHPENDVLEALAELHSGLKLSHQKGMHGYACTAVLGTESEGPVARVMYGGTHEYPHAILSSEWAQPGAELIRARFPVHTVSRADVREDFGEVDAYDRIQSQVLDVARNLRVRVGTAGDHLVTMKGRTCYLGAPSSAVRLRLYDKAAEMRSKLPPPKVSGACPIAYGERYGIPEHLTRLEAQIRPHTKEARREFATLEPTEMLGCAHWMREVWRGVAGLELAPVQVGRGWRPSDDERAYRYMLAQYGGVLRRMRADAGSWECVGLQLGTDLATGGGAQ